MKYTVLDYLEKTAEIYPDKVAFADVSDSITWKSLVDESKSLSGAIAKYFPKGLSKKKWAALIILNLQENSNLLKFKYEQRRKR